jgi:Mce-associated membrane protein
VTLGDARRAKVQSDDEQAEQTDDAPHSAEQDVVDTDRPWQRKPRPRWSRPSAVALLAALALVLTLGAGWSRYQADSAQNAATDRAESVAAAKASTVAILSYRPDTAEQQLGAARELLTGSFRDSYSSLIHDIVIPGAKQQKITATATVAAAAAVSADDHHAVVLVFVDQTATTGSSAPSGTTSSVRVGLDKQAGRWLISAFDPV